MKKTLIGRFAVDSGQAMIGDPSYLENWKNWDKDVDEFEDHVNHVGEYGYLGACGVTLKESFGQLGSADAVVFSTGYGDGLYPVFVQMNSEGRVSKVVIDFEGDIEIDE
jgi:hypothetical protein